MSLAPCPDYASLGLPGYSRSRPLFPLLGRHPALLLLLLLPAFHFMRTPLRCTPHRYAGQGNSSNAFPWGPNADAKDKASHMPSQKSGYAIPGPEPVGKYSPKDLSPFGVASTRVPARTLANPIAIRPNISESHSDTPEH